MIPAKAWVDNFGTELAAGLSTLSGGTFRVYPIVAPYSPGPQLQLADIVRGTGTLGQKFKAAAAITGTDPTTGLEKIFVPTRAGGWTWTYDAITPPPPQTVYGFALVDTANALLLAVSERLTTPLVLTGPALFEFGEASALVSAIAVG